MMASISRRFITVEELEEQRRQRIEAGKSAEDEAPFDPRSLFEQLQAQKDEKQRVLDEQRAFKNQVRGLNEEETLFLDECAQRQEAKEQEADLELRLLISEAGTKVPDALTLPPVRPPPAKLAAPRRVSAQRASLMGAVKRRREEKPPASAPKVARASEPEAAEPESAPEPEAAEPESAPESEAAKPKSSSEACGLQNVSKGTNLLLDYSDSDSDAS